MTRTALILGIASQVGKELGGHFDADDDIEQIVGLDAEPPRPVPEKCIFRRWTRAEPLGPALFGVEIDLAVYLPPFPVGHAVRDLDDQRTLNAFLEASVAAGAKRILVASGFRVHQQVRSREQISEGAPLIDGAGRRGRRSALGVSPPDLAREACVAAFAREHPAVALCLCRLAPVVGPGTSGLAARLVARRRLVAPAEGDPRLQFLHAEDAGLAMYRLLSAGRSGVYHLAPDDDLSLSDLARCLKRPIARLSPGLFQALAGPGRFLGLDRLSGVDRVLSPLFANRISLCNRKIGRDVGYSFRYASDGALADHLARQPARA